MSLANRLNQIITEQKVSKREFAKRVGISENYVYTLTGESNKITTLSTMLAKVIAMEFGYDAEWILHGEKKCCPIGSARFWTAPNCTDSTKKIPGRKILSFKQSGVAQAAPLLFLVGCVDDYRNRCSYQSKF